MLCHDPRPAECLAPLEPVVAGAVSGGAGRVFWGRDRRARAGRWRYRLGAGQRHGVRRDHDRLQRRGGPVRAGGRSAPPRDGLSGRCHQPDAGGAGGAGHTLPWCCRPSPPAPPGPPSRARKWCLPAWCRWPCTARLCLCRRYATATTFCPRWPSVTRTAMPSRRPPRWPGSACGFRTRWCWAWRPRRSCCWRCHSSSAPSRWAAAGATVLQSAVHLVLFAVFVFLAVVP